MIRISIQPPRHAWVSEVYDPQGVSLYRCTICGARKRLTYIPPRIIPNCRWSRLPQPGKSTRMATADWQRWMALRARSRWIGIGDRR